MNTLTPQEKEQVKSLLGELAMSRATMLQILLYMEIAKLDTSGVGYRWVREYLPEFLATTQACSPVLDFIANEMSRERPFYPDNGRLVTDAVMVRSIQVGLEIVTIKDNYPDRSIMEDIIPEISRKMNKSFSTIKQDYEQRFKPIYNKAREQSQILLDIEYAQAAKLAGMEYHRLNTI